MNFQNNIHIVVCVNNLLGTRLKGMGRKGGCVGDSGVDEIWIALCLASGQQADVRVTNFPS